MEWIGFELHPETPAAGVRVRDVLPEGTAIEDVYQQFNNHGREYGINFKVNEVMPKSRYALEATEFAREKGLFDAFQSLVFKGYFTDGRDIGRIPVLLEMAGELGLDQEALRLALESGTYTPVVKNNHKRAMEAMVVVLPTFFIGDERVVGIKDYAHFQRICAGRGL